MAHRRLDFVEQQADAPLRRSDVEQSPEPERSHPPISAVSGGRGDPRPTAPFDDQRERGEEAGGA